MKKKNPLLVLEATQTKINLMNLSHTFRDGDNWVAVTASGSRYNLTDDEYAKLNEFFEPEEGEGHGDPHENFDKMMEKFGEMLKKFKEMGLRIDNVG